MIVKKVPARPAGRNATVERATHARRLVDYLRSPEKESAEKAYMVKYMLEAKLGQTAGERLFHQGARGFVSTTPAGQRAEMIAIAQMAKRSPNPVDHWILSWPEGELPEPDQIDEVVAMFVEHLGVADQPFIYAVHGDTDNRHLHIALNRYDALARRMVEINDGFNLEAAHQAVAIIVDRFGWRPEVEARYEVAGDQVQLTASAQARIEEGREAITAKAAAYELRTGYRSAQRIAQDDAVPIIAAAKSWRELHAGLAEAGMTYTLKGTNGVLIGVGEEKVKASSVARAVTRMRLEERLGSFEPPAPTIAMTPREPELDRFPDALRADEYRAERERRRKRHQPDSSAAEPEQPEVAEEAGQVFGTSGNLQGKFGKAHRAAPDLETWYRVRNEHVLAERWRNHKRLRPFPAFVGEPQSQWAHMPRIDAYHAYSCSDGVRYARGPLDPTAFIDRGSRVEVVLDTDEALLAGLRLAVLKTGGPVIVRAEPDVRDRILALAKVNGLLPFLQEPERQKAPQSHDALAASPEPSTDAPPASMDQTVDDAPSVAADRRQIEPSDLQARSTPPSAETAPLPSDEPSPAVEALLATPAEKAAAPSSPPRLNVGEGRQSGGAAQQLVRDHFRKEAERKGEPEAEGVERSIDLDTRAEARPTKTLDPEQTRTKDGKDDRRQTTARSPQPQDKPRRSLGKGPEDLDDLPPGWPPGRGSSRG